MNVFDGFQALAVEQAPAVIDPIRFEPDPKPSEPAPAGPQSPASSASPTPAPDFAARAKPSPPAAAAIPDVAEIPAKPIGERVREFAQGRIVTPLRERALRKPSPNAARIALCALLGFVLASQMAYAFRSQLAARYPVMKSVLNGVCGLAGCTVTLPQRPDLVKIEASDVHMIDANRPALIQLTATLRSYASYDLAYPALDLVLTNANEHALARRIFVPAQYLDDTRDPESGIPPRAEITVALDLDTGDLNAAGFRLDLIAAPVP